jgi:putative membrane protein
MRWIVRLLINAIALLIVTRFIAGFHVDGFLAALIAAVIISLINATIGAFLKFITLPLTFVTLGLFWWVINALMLILASQISPGFHVDGFLPAFIGAIILALVNFLLKWIVGEVEGREV